jgi:hypothetical protein
MGPARKPVSELLVSAVQDVRGGNSKALGGPREQVHLGAGLVGLANDGRVLVELRLQLNAPADVVDPASSPNPSAHRDNEEMHYAWRRSLRPLHDDTQDPKQQPFETGRDAGLVSLAEMREVPVVVVLGERGSGKSVALDQERALLADDGVAVAALHLGRDISDPISAGADLRRHLTPPQDRPEQHVLLDGLDEGMSDIQGLDKVLLRELRQTQPDLRAKLRLRIVCRTTRWPEFLERGAAGTVAGRRAGCVDGARSTDPTTHRDRGRGTRLGRCGVR